jgi:hypothetical protein
MVKWKAKWKAKWTGKEVDKVGRNFKSGFAEFGGGSGSVSQTKYFGNGRPL